MLKIIVNDFSLKCVQKSIINDKHTHVYRRSYNRPEASQVGIIITGSPSRYLEQSKHISRKSAKAGVHYIAIGVGNLTDDEELRIITGSNERHIYRLKSFKDLENIVAEVAVKLCQGNKTLINKIDKVQPRN